MSALRRRVYDWLETRDGLAPACPPSGIRVVPLQTANPALRAWYDGRGALLGVKRDWLAAAERLADEIGPVELFSAFGTYELARFTLADGLGVWGPTWYYAGDAKTLTPATDPRVRRVAPEEVTQIDRAKFWHSVPDASSPAFGVFEGDNLVALSVAWQRAEEVWEIGLDALPEATGRGLGRAVFSAAARWILDRDGLVVATTAPWNVPSVRTLRRCGMHLVVSELRDAPAPMRVPPQTLGSPMPGCELRNYYPDWAQNHAIRPRLPASGTPPER
jgi:GNAT superfamily N-acetyltransferase